MEALAFAEAPQTFFERVSRLLESVDYRLALDEEDKDAIYRLRYDAYLREGAITPSFSRRFQDKYDDADNCWTYGFYIDGRLVGSIRFHIATSTYPDMPAGTSFPEILLPELDAGRVIVDPTRFVIDFRASRAYPELRYVIVRLPFIACEFFRADMLLATVRSEHQAFYKRVFGHQVAAPARPYPMLAKPISLMTLDYFGMKERVQQRYPFFRSAFFERRMLFDVAAMTPSRRPTERPLERPAVHSDNVAVL
jgi:hypothetical protein